MYTKKPSAQETYERRIKVFRMKMRGLNHTAIARELCGFVWAIACQVQNENPSIVGARA